MTELDSLAVKRTGTVPVAVVIPTFGRGDRVCGTLEKILECDPRPSEIWVHIDQSDGVLEREIYRRFPQVSLISSIGRLGPGGGRHTCLCRCNAEVAVSFDDDSYPVDRDFFGCVATLFESHPEATVIRATIWDRQQKEQLRGTSFVQTSSFVGCGHAIRVTAYRQISGYVPRAIAYGIEETDVALQLFSEGHKIFQSADLRVFHDTDLKHHQSPEITECVVANVALLAWLRYPVHLWSWGLLQLGSTISFCLRVGRWRGIIPGLLRIPADCFRFRKFRRVLPSSAVSGYLRSRKALP